MEQLFHRHLKIFKDVLLDKQPADHPFVSPTQASHKLNKQRIGDINPDKNFETKSFQKNEIALNLDYDDDYEVVCEIECEYHYDTKLLSDSTSDSVDDSDELEEILEGIESGNLGVILIERILPDNEESESDVQEEFEDTTVTADEPKDYRQFDNKAHNIQKPASKGKKISTQEELSSVDNSILQTSDNEDTFKEEGENEEKQEEKENDEQEAKDGEEDEEEDEEEELEEEEEEEEDYDQKEEEDMEMEQNEGVGQKEDEDNLSFKEDTTSQLKQSFVMPQPKFNNSVPKPQRKGLREVSSMRPGYHKLSSRLRRPSPQNDYRDPDLAPEVNSPQSTSSIEDKNQLPEIMSSENDILNKQTSSEARKINKNSSLTVKDFSDYTDKAQGTAPPDLNSVDYVTNYIEENGQVKTQVFKGRKKEKSQKWSVLESVSMNGKDFTSYINDDSDDESDDTLKRITIDMDLTSQQVRLLEAAIEHNPSLEKQENEDTATYLQRIYPELVSLMTLSRENKPSDQPVKMSMFLQLFGRLAKTSVTEQSKERHHDHVFQRVLNGSRFVQGYRRRESLATAKKNGYPSIIGAIAVMFILTF